MTRNKWKYVTDTKNSIIYVDYSNQRTKVTGTKNVYYYDGIYPNIDYNTRRKFKK